MPAEAELTPVEQKYFDTRGASEIIEQAPDIQEDIAAPGAAEGPAIAADEPADGADNADEGDKPEDGNPGKFVRHGAFHEERQRRKELEAQLTTVREQQAAERARLEERLNHLANAFKQPEPVITDPNERLARIEQTIAQQRQQEEQTAKAAQNEQNFYNAIIQAEQKFADEVPDYIEAIAFAKAERLKDIQALGFEGAEAEQVLQRDVLNLSDDAFRRGINPAERFYNFAKSRGWGKETPAAARAAQAPADKIKNITQGQQAAKSLGAAPGSSAPNLTLQALADMSQEDFDKIDAKTWKKMMGG